MSIPQLGGMFKGDFRRKSTLSEYGFRLGYGSAIARVLFLIMLVYIGYFLWRLYKNEREV